MKATVEEINTVQRRVKVVVSSDTVNKAFDAAYARLQKKAKVHGFRPGKAPISVIKKMYGSNVSYEVGEQLINEHLFPAIKEQGVNPIASPYVEAESAPLLDSAYEFSAVVDIMPSIQLEDQHKGLEVHCRHYETDEATLERELKGRARRQAKTSALEDPTTPAAAGHLAVISHTAHIGDRHLHDMSVKEASVGLGMGEMFPDLEAAIMGMRKGEKKEVTIKLPDDYEDKELAGKDVHFHISLDDLMALELPALDDDFAKDVNFDSFAEFKASIETQLASTVDNMNKQELEKALLTALLSKMTFEVPPTIVDQVIDSMIGDIRFKDEADRKKALKDDEIRKSMRPEAKNRARNTMALWEVIRKENLSVNDDEIKEHISKFFESSGEQSEEQIASAFSSMSDRIRENLLFEKAIAFLQANAKIIQSSEKL